MALFLVACRPSAPAAESIAVSSSSVAARKVLTISVTQEPPHIEGFTGNAGRGGSGAIKYMVHDYLVHEDDRPDYTPHLALEIPSIDKGSWQLNPDGTMDMTWSLRPDIRWHDGTPFTSADLLFSFGVYKDPDLPTAYSPTLALMASANALDPRTFSVHWSRTYPFAFQAEGLVPLPRHLLEDTYREGSVRADKQQGFVNSTYFNRDWVGLGPYRLVKWEAGAQLELVRFDGYYAGRPPFDTVTVRFISDANTMLANILASAVDVVMPPNVDLGTALELQRRWEGTGNQVLMIPSGRQHAMQIQLRPEYAKPNNGFTNRTVRQAFMSVTDRQALVDVITQGIGTVSDSYARPADSFRTAVESSIVQYPYDPARAQQLLAEAGWKRGSDGVLVNDQTGERFEAELWGRRAAAGQEREPTIVADQWSQVGAKMTPFVIPPAREADRGFAATMPTIQIADGFDPAEWYVARLHSRNVATAENRWSGRNLLGYSNPRVDQLLDQLQVTIDPNQRNALHRELLQEETTDVAFMPLYWEVVSVLAVKGVRLAPYGNRTGANFAAWDRE